MAESENLTVQDYFVKSKKVWFPDFSEMLETQGELYSKSKYDLSSLLTVLRYFRRELSKKQFATYFLEQKAPEKMLSKQRELYNCAHELCMAYQNQSISNTEFDERLLLAFRHRPTEDVFLPVFESWDEINSLISRLEKKGNRLPIYFDGLGWNGYLKGIVTSRQYVEWHLNWGTGDHLCQLLACGTDEMKKDLNETYSMEVSVVLRLRELCMEYRDQLVSPDSFEAQFLELAREFSSNIPE